MLAPSTTRANDGQVRAAKRRAAQLGYEFGSDTRWSGPGSECTPDDSRDRRVTSYLVVIPGMTVAEKRGVQGTDWHP